MSLIKRKDREKMKLLEYEEAIHRIESAGMGFPPLGGEAAGVWGKVKNYSVPLEKYGGDGDLAEGCERITDPDDFGLLAEELGVGVPSALSPDTPEPDPEGNLPEGVEDPEAGLIVKVVPDPTETASAASAPEAVPTSDVSNALETLRASKCGKKARLEAAEALADHITWQRQTIMSQEYNAAGDQVQFLEGWRDILNRLADKLEAQLGLGRH